jgi:hypothetical protein
MEEEKNRLTSFHNETNVPDTIPSFLLKTYEILEVILPSCRMKNMRTLYAGHGMGRASLSKKLKNLLTVSCLFTLGTVTIPRLFGK